MNKSKSKITSHIHVRIAKLAQQAFDADLILQCSRTPDNTYLIRRTGEIAPTEHNAISTGVILLSLLGIADSRIAE